MKKQIHTERKEILFPLSIENCCTAVHIPPGAAAVTAVCSADGCTPAIGIYAVAGAVNDLAARGAAPVSVQLSLLFPVSAMEEEVRELVCQVEEICLRHQIQIAGVQGEVTPAVSRIVVHAAAFGEVQEEQLIKPGCVKPGQDIVLCGYIGLEGTLRILEECRQELEERFAPVLFRQVHALKKELFCPEAVFAAAKQHAAVIRQIGSGGIFAALWNLAEEEGVGLTADMARMSIRQETVEICEYYRLNPYQMASAGSFLLVADKGEMLVECLRAHGARADRLGVTTAGNARVITSGKERRYLERPAPDELVLWRRRI